jgi:hypothetical protein
MRVIVATLKPVVHLPLGIAATVFAMAGSIAVALSSPHPPTVPQVHLFDHPPKAVVASLPAAVVGQAIRNFSLARLEQPQEAAPEQPQEIVPVDPSPPQAESIDAAAEARAYLAETAYPGGSITILGREKSVACFHPQFAINLAAAIRDAREHGLPEAAVFSGCRPPRLGIGGFKDKKKSLHAVGLAADIHGIGRPCSSEAKLFHKIAAAHGVAGVYGPCNRAEWNHVQGTEIKMTTSALRETFTDRGEITPDLEHMWLIEKHIVLPVGQPVTETAVAVSEDHRSRERKHRSAKRRHADKHRVARGQKHTVRHKHAHAHRSEHQQSAGRHRRGKHVAER